MRRVLESPTALAILFVAIVSALTLLTLDPLGHAPAPGAASAGTGGDPGTAGSARPSAPAPRAPRAGARRRPVRASSPAPPTRAPRRRPAPVPVARSRPAPLPRLPVASRWSLPPVMTLSAQRGAAPGVARRALAPAASARVALAPAVAAALRAGREPAALAALLALPRSPLGPVLVLGLEGRTVRAQATSLLATRRTLRGLAALPAGRRPAILLEAAAEDRADLAGPPPPRAGELASLVPLYQAAGQRHGVSWRILAAINLVETDLGRNTGRSTAGAVGWMQFMPATWRQYGTDANGDGVADPHEPSDAIYSAARYLEAAGARRDIARAVFAYNHADWYVRRVLALAARLPEQFGGAA